jgi:uncharacterized protein
MLRTGWMLWLVLLCLLTGMPVVAEDTATVPALQGRVNDYAGVLDANAASIEARLAAQERASGNQVVVLTVSDLGGRDIESYANDVLHAWKLGRQGVDDGVLIVLAVKDRRARIEVGYGLEGTLTDLASSRILRETMHPRFAAGDYAGGMEAGVDAVLAALAGQEAQGTPVEHAHEPQWFPWWAFLLPLGMAALFGWIAAMAGGWKILWLPMMCLIFPFAMAPWPAALAILLAYLAGIFGLRYRWMRAEYMRRTANGRRRTRARYGSWPPRFIDVWCWRGLYRGRRRRGSGNSSGGAVGFWDSGSSSGGGSDGSSSSSSDSFSGGGGDSGGGGSSDSW